MSKLFAMPLAAWVVLMAGVAALSTAFIAQYFFDVEPCDLCIWQRWPYGLAIVIGVAALLLKPYDVRSRVLLGVAAVVFFAGTGLAVHHTGVEQGWWASAGSCAIKPIGERNIADMSLNDMRDRLMATAGGASCDEITWSFLGLSMANWNILVFLLLAAFAAIAAVGCVEDTERTCGCCCSPPDKKTPKS